MFTCNPRKQNDCHDETSCMKSKQQRPGFADLSHFMHIANANIMTETLV